ncbi:hypothetical protein [Streptomyces sp. NBC_01518]|uniref:hypothetical protein n=1 Tax=Streptomyces sp. NBC_01518 TaxID=2903891 RepID=UPI003863AEB4
MTLRRGFISDNRADFGVQRICQVLQFSRSGFYWWIAGAKAREMRQAADDFLEPRIPVSRCPRSRGRFTVVYSHTTEVHPWGGAVRRIMTAHGKEPP